MNIRSSITITIEYCVFPSYETILITFFLPPVFFPPLQYTPKEKKIKIFWEISPYLPWNFRNEIFTREQKSSLKKLQLYFENILTKKNHFFVLFLSHENPIVLFSSRKIRFIDKEIWEIKCLHLAVESLIWL
jgi:hypothetical protein